MAGATLTVGVLAVTAILAAGCATAGAVSVRVVRLAATADAAALAAADAASGAVAGIPCERAEQLAAHGGAQVSHCTLDGLVATVSVTAALGPFTAVATSRAGPPS